jgi:pyruvate,water dikinase
VVRSSSTIEDVGTSSMAGRFTSVLGVVGWEALLTAVHRVVASAASVRDERGAVHPLAVLVQRQLEAYVGGVMFGVDPVTGATRHVVVEAVSGGPERLVGGTALADHYVLSRRGRIVRSTLTGDVPALGAGERRALTAMARRANEVFGGPQDVEWLFDHEGALWLLQSRPVTAVGAPDDRGGADEAPSARHSVLLGPGPVAETFPDPLRPLEEDLWVAPLRQGLVRALHTTGVVSSRAIERSPVITTVGRRVAVDLELLGVADGRTTMRHRANPAALARRLGAAWRVGRLRVALPRMAEAIVSTVDRDLAAIPRLDELTDTELEELLVRCGTELATVHSYEVVAGILLPRGDGADGPAAGTSSAARALAALSAARAAGWDEAATVSGVPIVLALVPPRIGGRRLPPTGVAPLDRRTAVRLDESVDGQVDRPVVVPGGRLANAAPRDPLIPAAPGEVRGLSPSSGAVRGWSAVPGEVRGLSAGPGEVRGLPAREALRIRVRWLQELGARVAEELAHRLVGAGVLASADLVPWLRLDELRSLVAGGPPPVGLVDRTLVAAGPPLPTSFRLTTSGAVRPGGGERIGRRVVGAVGLPAGGGRGEGVVVQTEADALAASAAGTRGVLVVRHLEPQLAAVLPHLAGLVAETGSALSHLAILAREVGVPTVVAVERALDRYPPGIRIVVEGRTGEIDVLATADDAVPAWSSNESALGSVSARPTDPATGPMTGSLTGSMTGPTTGPTLGSSTGPTTGTVTA